MDLVEFLPVFMFVVLGGVGLAFGLIGAATGEFMMIQFGTRPSRIHGGIM